ncbi:MAG: OmpA family protein, partial [Saprospiraceae bacterium]
PVSLLSGNQPTDIDQAATPGEETDYVYLDPETGIWMDKDTRLPAESTYDDGKTYEKGILISGGPDLKRGHTTPSEEDNFAIPYLLHIYYDFDKSYIRDDAKPELEKLFTLMTENPQYIIEIGSHTDARGTNLYNKRLSQRRAEAVVRWLADRGIDRHRLVARGYGETKNVNDCTNNVPCSERQHQMNRRTEFKVIGCIDCIDPAKTAISKANPNVEVDECKTCPF